MNEFDAEKQKLYLSLEKEQARLDKAHEQLGRKMNAHEKTWQRLKKLFEQYSREHDEIGNEAVRLEREGADLDERIEKFYREQEKGTLIEPTINEDGDPVVELEKDGVAKTFSVAYLVAQAFVPNPDNLPYVRHKDGDKLNNRADNLEWSAEEEQ